jgi:serine/threonine protein kinase
LILRKLSEDINNIFTTKLLDLIIPEGVINKDDFDLSKLDHIFLVLEKGEKDLSSLFKNYKNLELEEDQVVIIMYNILCAMNFFHSANIIHRDIKPGNILIDSSCSIKIIDFGLARVMPKKTNLEQTLFEFKNIKMAEICSQKNIDKRQGLFSKYKQEVSIHLEIT